MKNTILCSNPQLGFYQQSLSSTFLHSHLQHSIFWAAFFIFLGNWDIFLWAAFSIFEQLDNLFLLSGQPQQDPSTSRRSRQLWFLGSRLFLGQVCSFFFGLPLFSRHPILDSTSFQLTSCYPWGSGHLANPRVAYLWGFGRLLTLGQQRYAQTRQWPGERNGQQIGGYEKQTGKYIFGQSAIFQTVSYFYVG